MCKHVPVLIYDCGGTQKVCGSCGKPLSDWKDNGVPKKHKKEKKDNGDTKSTVRSNQT